MFAGLGGFCLFLFDLTGFRFLFFCRFDSFLVLGVWFLVSCCRFGPFLVFGRFEQFFVFGLVFASFEVVFLSILPVVGFCQLVGYSWFGRFLVFGRFDRF